MAVSDWFDVMYIPKASSNPLTTGSANTLRQLKSIESGYSNPKNTEIRLSEILRLNAIDISDPIGDDINFVLATEDLAQKYL